MKEASTILIVDDERSNILALTHILKPHYSVLAAIDGHTALKIVKERPPDLILLDIIMPEISGFELLEQLKRDETTFRIPVIFITGLDSVEDQDKGFALGAVDYITKPFHSAIVKARVKTHLKIVEYINTIERLSVTDMLTNTLNKRGLEEHLKVEWHRAVREKTPLSALMIDLDHFKKYNDTYGHLQGDIALQTLAQIFRKTAKRATDSIARFGGEEFVVLLPNTGGDNAAALAEEIRANVSAAVIAETEATMTISIGVNTMSPQGRDKAEDLIAGADEALYHAKETGRNRVCRYQEGTP